MCLKQESELSGEREFCINALMDRTELLVDAIELSLHVINFYSSPSNWGPNGVAHMDGGMRASVAMIKILELIEDAKRIEVSKRTEEILEI